MELNPDFKEFIELLNLNKFFDYTDSPQKLNNFS